MLSTPDDKSQHCIPFIIERLENHRRTHREKQQPLPPFFLGINGPQGVGKTTLVSILESTLNSSPYNLRLVVFSIDDLYLTHHDQLALAAAYPDNRLIQHRGQPGTHDIALGISVFRALRECRPTCIPKYDKSAFSGQGDRLDRRFWKEVNQPGSDVVELVIFEGWCVGFKALDPAELEAKWHQSTGEKNEQSRLWRYTLADLLFVNRALQKYDGLTEYAFHQTNSAIADWSRKYTSSLDALIHLDAANIQSIYPWRAQQEAVQRALKGTGMTDEEIIRFVDGYYPAYELYTEHLRRGIFGVKAGGAQLRLVVGDGREVRAVERI